MSFKLNIKPLIEVVAVVVVVVVVVDSLSLRASSRRCIESLS